MKIVQFPMNGEIEYRFYSTDVFTGAKSVEDDCSEVKNLSSLEKVQGEIRSINESYRRTKQAIYCHARANVWEWFVTYTFDPAKIDSTDYDKCYKSISNHLKHVKKKYCRDMRYIVVPELHSDGKKYHFHALMSNIDELSFVDSGKRDKGKVIYNIGNYTLGWTTALRIGNNESGATSNYITKYITKEFAFMVRGRQRYLVSQNLDKPVVETLKLSLDKIIEMKNLLKEKTTSAKVVRVETDSFTNEIEYINIKL